MSARSRHRMATGDGVWPSSSRRSRACTPSRAKAVSSRPGTTCTVACALSVFALLLSVTAGLASGETHAIDWQEALCNGREGRNGAQTIPYLRCAAR